MYPVQLGLGPGKYRVTVDADGRAFEANVTLEEGKATRLGQPQLTVAQLQPTQARGEAPRGDSASQPTTVAALAFANRPSFGGYASATAWSPARKEGSSSITAISWVWR
jgi:hypothetical protein